MLSRHLNEKCQIKGDIDEKNDYVPTVVEGW